MNTPPMQPPLAPALDDAHLPAVDAAAALFGLPPLEPAWRTAAAASFATVESAARLVAEFPLDDEAEYAPVFRA